jgi:hypothetical protein
MILYKKIALFHVQYASGEISLIAVWNLDQEQLVSSIPLHSESGVSALVRSVYICLQLGGHEPSLCPLLDLQKFAVLKHLFSELRPWLYTTTKTDRFEIL